MSRNTYDDAFGVARIRWQRDDLPDTNSPILVEVWRSDVDAGLYTEDAKPKVVVRASMEIWVLIGPGERRRIGYRGNLGECDPGEVRRWAYLPGTKRWSATVTLDRWENL